MPDTTTNYGWPKPDAVGERFSDNVARDYLDQIDADLFVAVGAAGAWTSYVPTVTAGTGTFTSAAAVGRYKQMGKTIMLRIAVTITTNGTAASYVNVTLPFATPNNEDQAMSGSETAVVGKGLRATLLKNTSNARITFYDATYPGANGHVLVIEGVYEAA
jgi:hypothetical protein